MKEWSPVSNLGFGSSHVAESRCSEQKYKDWRKLEKDRNRGMEQQEAAVHSRLPKEQAGQSGGRNGPGHLDDLSTQQPALVMMTQLGSFRLICSICG